MPLLRSSSSAGRWWIAALAVAASPLTVASQTLVAESKPQGARVEVDGVAVGVTPLTASVESGMRTVRLFRDGYEVWERSVRAAPGDTVFVGAPMARLRGTVVVAGAPGGSVVLVDGQPADGAASVEVGGVAVEVAVPGRAPFRIGVPVYGGVETTVTYRRRQFRPNLALVTALVPGGAQVLDGRPTVGALALGGTVASVGVALAGQLAFNDAQRDHRAALTQYRNANSEAEVEAALAQLDGNRAQRIRRTQRGALVVASALYLAAGVDALLHHVWQPGLDVASPRAPDLALDGAGVRLTIPL